MKLLKLLLKNLLRNRLRTLLTITSIAASLFLVVTLLTLLASLTNPPETPDSALRLITRHKISLLNALPTAYLDKIAAVEGVEAVIGSMWFGGTYDDRGETQQLGQFAVTTDDFFLVNPEMEVPEAQRDAFLEDRSTALVGEAVAKRFGWKIGDNVHFGSNLFPIEIELKIAAIYSGGSDNGSSIFFHWEYFNEALDNQGIMGTFSIRATSAQQVPLVAQRVDALFKNTTQPTHTESEKAFLLSFVSMLGNVQLLISSICLAVIFAVVLIAANTMAMSIRERVREIGILKALGFRKNQVLAVLLGESVLLGLLGALVGAGGARFIFGRLDVPRLTSGFLQQLEISWNLIGYCLLLGAIVGLIAAGVPAWRSARKPAIEALRGVV